LFGIIFVFKYINLTYILSTTFLDFFWQVFILPTGYHINSHLAGFLHGN